MTRWTLGLVAVVALSATASAQYAVQRGDYLVNTIMTCGNCHCPRARPPPSPARIFPADFASTSRRSMSPRRTSRPTRNTGIGNWSDSRDQEDASSTGMQPNGVPLAPIMPSDFYAILTPGDADAIVAYLQSLKPVKNKVPDPIYKISRSAASVFPAPRSRWRPPTERQDQARLLSGLHRPLPGMPHALVAGQARVRQRSARAAANFPGPWGMSLSRNITLEQDRRYRRLDRRRDQDARSPRASARTAADEAADGLRLLRQMTDSDLDAVIAYLRTLPAKE